MGEHRMSRTQHLRHVASRRGCARSLSGKNTHLRPHLYPSVNCEMIDARHNPRRPWGPGLAKREPLFGAALGFRRRLVAQTATAEQTTAAHGSAWILNSATVRSRAPTESLR
jgi:hypothetical protein